MRKPEIEQCRDEAREVIYARSQRDYDEFGGRPVTVIGTGYLSTYGGASFRKVEPDERVSSWNRAELRKWLVRFRNGRESLVEARKLYDRSPADYAAASDEHDRQDRENERQRNLIRNRTVAAATAVADDLGILGHVEIIEIDGAFVGYIPAGTIIIRRDKVDEMYQTLQSRKETTNEQATRVGR
jgi:hypothetical protein